MEIVKKNLISIICGVIAIIALVAVFLWPLDGFFEGLKEKANTRGQVLGKLNSLKNKHRVVPVIDVKNQTAPPLTKYPSKQIIGLGETAQKLMRTQSDKMYVYAWQLNQKGHELTVRGTLPTVESAAIAFDIRKRMIEALNNLRTKELEAGIPPTPEQLDLRKKALLEEMSKDIIVLGDGSKPNEPQIMAKYEAEALKLPDIMKKEMASKYKMYIDPAKVLVVSPSLPEANAPRPRDIWWSQVSFWISSDVAATIKELNANSSSVLDSPVKNLIALSIPEDFFPPIEGAVGARPDAAGDVPTSPTGGRPDPTIAIPDNGANTPTKRASNNLYDVVQFKMTLDIEADKITLFLKTLPTNRFITVTRVEMTPVDSQIQQKEGYVYGQRPVVTLTLDCEALFMREWTISLMPNDIRGKLGVADTAAKP